jgi:hypothetical protein
VGKSGNGTKQRPGLPKPESITGQRTFTSPQGKLYRILSTDETDAYEDQGAKAKKPPAAGKTRRKPVRKPKSVP